MPDEVERTYPIVQFSASWRFTVTVLALLSLANAVVLWIPGVESGLITVIGVLSWASGVALVASLRYRIRRFTLLVTMLVFVLQTYDWVFCTDFSGPTKFRLGLGAASIALLAFGAWVHAMQDVWPPWRKIWKVPML